MAKLVFAPPETTWGLFEATPGIGKTSALVIPSILHRAERGYSLVIPDVKEDLAVMLAPGLRRRGYEVWVINPARHHLDAVSELAVNLYQPVVDAVYAEGEERRNAVKLAADYASIHYPMKGDEKNPYFAHGSRRALITAILSNALHNPKRCTPTDAYLLLADPKKFLARLKRVSKFLETHIPDDPLVETLKAEARNLLHRAENNEENFAAFLEGATQRLLTYNPAGMLGGYGRDAVQSISEVRDRQIIVFIMTPLSHLREFESFVSLLNHNIIAACKNKPDGHPLHIVGEEALAYYFPELTTEMETLRQLRVSADLYIQSYSGLEKKYGREAASAIESYADVRLYAGLNSYGRARFVSDMLAEKTVRKQDFSYAVEAQSVSVSSRELGRRLMTPDEVLAMPKNRAWVFVRGTHPLNLRLIHYGQVRPWCDWVDPSPITRTKLPSNPLFEIRYPEKGGAHV